jgi:uncharacterized protein (TIGR01777 family)
MQVLVAGASGLVGTALVAGLRVRGHDVLRLVRRVPRSSEELRWQPGLQALDPSVLDKVDAVVNLAGENIAAGRWTAGRRHLIRASRLETTKTLVRAMVENPRQRVLVNASAVGIYGDRGSEMLSENSMPGEGFLAELCVDWEDEAFAASFSGARVVCLRLGLVLSSRGGVLARMTPAFRLGLGCSFGDGSAWMSWIALPDLVAVIIRCLEDKNISGPVNAVAPQFVTNAEFSDALAAALNRKRFFRAPRFLLKLLFGEMAEETLLASTRVQPAVLQKLGFEYTLPSLPEALSDILLPRT